MAQRNFPPFRADHVGSLLRPQELLDARADAVAGRIGPAELRRIEDLAIGEVVHLQESIGLKGITDGEFRRGSWHMDYLYQIGGVAKVQDNLTVRFHNAAGDLEFTPSALKVVEKLRLNHCIFGEDFAYLKSQTTATPKLTIPSPSMMHYRGGHAVFQSVYADVAEFWHDLAQVYADEIAVLGRLGCSYLQLDDTSLAYLNDPAQRDYISGIGGRGSDQHLSYIRLINAAVAQKPAGMTICTHLCRGNFKSSWVASGGYDYVADALFNQLDVDGYFLEYDDERSGGFAPLRFVPKGKTIVLGLITSKRPTLETKDEIKRRLDEASKYLSLDQICLSPQCGFSSTVEGNALTIDEEVAKLRLVTEIADEIWG